MMMRKPDIRALRPAVLAVAALITLGAGLADAAPRRHDAPRGGRNIERGGRHWDEDRRPAQREFQAPEPRQYREPGRPVRRGAFLPDDRRGAPVGDYGGARLRAPPQGYGWYRSNGRYMLLDRNTGQVLDVVE